MNEIIYQPRNGEEMKRATYGAPIYKYSNLCYLAKQIGVVEMLNQMFSRSLDNIILLQDPDKMNSGHWMGLSYNPEKCEIYFFSSYGGKPDFEKNKWITEDDQFESGQDMNAFNDGLKQLAEEGYSVHYNNHRYQKEGDKTATCGIWTAAFLNSGLNPEEFYKYSKRHGFGPLEYFNLYFV